MVTQLSHTIQVSRTSVALNQIELDLLRTLPNNCHYHNPDDKGVCPLVFLLFNCVTMVMI